MTDSTVKKIAVRVLLGLIVSTSVAVGEEGTDLNAKVDLSDQVKVEERINLLIEHLSHLRAKAEPLEVKDYTFVSIDGDTSLSKLFGTRTKLLVIHNMGSECNYCTLWADGFNGILPHLEDAMAVVMVSGEPPEVQAALAKQRNWGFTMVSHKDLPYTGEQTTLGEWTDMPGATVYEKIGDKILLRNKCFFEPNDIYCAMWPLLGLAGIQTKDWQPAFDYKTRNPDEEAEAAD